MREALILAFVVLWGAAAHADTLTIANGDHLTGTIIRSDSKELVFKTDYAGEIHLQWSAVREVMSAEPIYVVTPDGKTVSGNLATEGGALVVTPPNAPAERVPLTNVTVLRSANEQKAYEQSLHPTLLQNWDANSSVGFGLARGNSHTTNLNLAFNGTRTTLHDKFAMYANSLYASSAAVIAPIPGITANDIRGGARYDHDLDERLLVFGSADFEYNELQFLNLRSILGGGAGYHVIKSPATAFDVFGGLNYTRESYSTGVRRNIAALTIGDTLQHKLNKTTTLTQSLNFYPDLSNAGEYRFAFDFGVSTKIAQWIAWQTSISDRYLSDPIPGTVSNDFFFTTGLNFTLVHQK